MARCVLLPRSVRWESRRRFEAPTAGTGGPSWKICDDKPAPRIPSPSGCAASAVRCCFSPLRRISRCAAAKQSRLRGRGPSPRRNAARRTVPRRGCKVRPRSKSGCPARPKPLTPATSRVGRAVPGRGRGMAIGVVQRLRLLRDVQQLRQAAPGHRRDGRVQSESPAGHRLPDQPHDARPVGVAEGQSRSQAARGHEGPRLCASGPTDRQFAFFDIQSDCKHPTLFSEIEVPSHTGRRRRLRSGREDVLRRRRRELHRDGHRRPRDPQADRALDVSHSRPVRQRRRKPRLPGAAGKLRAVRYTSTTFNGW